MCILERFNLAVDCRINWQTVDCWELLQVSAWAVMSLSQAYAAEIGGDRFEGVSRGRIC